MRTVIQVERADCCVFNNSLNREIAALNGVYAVNIDNYKNEVTIDHTDEVSFEEIYAKLEDSGYTPLGGRNREKTDYSTLEWPEENQHN